MTDNNVEDDYISRMGMTDDNEKEDDDDEEEEDR